MSTKSRRRHKDPPYRYVTSSCSCVRLPARETNTPPKPERWSFFITVPRMYPHVPPVITNVTRDFASAFFSDKSNNARIVGEEQCPSASRTGTVIMQNQAEPPPPEVCSVEQQPPSWPRSHVGQTPDGGSKTLCIDVDTAHFTNWTPLCGIGDLVSWLMTMPARRREWWSEESNRRKHHTQLHQRRNAAASPLGAQPLLLPEPTASERHRSETEEVGIVMMDASPRDASPRKPDSNPCSVNRFDVGYARGGACDVFMGL